MPRIRTNDAETYYERHGDGLELDRPAICGLSLGGMIAQTYAVQYDQASRALVLADTVVSVALTLSDELLNLLVPGWLLRATVRLFGPKRYTDLAFRLAALTRGANWFGRDDDVRAYVRETMSAFDAATFNEILRAVYGFRPVRLRAIRIPTLVVNGEFESRSLFAHAAYMQRMIPDARTAVVPDAGHVSNMENPSGFSAEFDAFLAATLATDE